MAIKEDEILRMSGIEVAVEQPDSQVRVECLRAAQRINHSGCSAIGLLPASVEIGVVGVGVNLAIAFAEISGSTVGYVDANLRWPALAHLAAATRKDDASDPSLTSAFSTRWLRGDVGLLIPHQRGILGAGAGLVALQKLLAGARDLFAHCLVDLTGWKRLGEHQSAFALVDGVVVVARAGVTTEDQLLRINHELRPDQHLGVLLLGAEQQ